MKRIRLLILCGVACAAFAQESSGAPAGSEIFSVQTRGQTAETPLRAFANLYQVAVEMTGDPSSGYDPEPGKPDWPYATDIQKQWRLSVAVNGGQLTMEERKQFIPCAANLNAAIDAMERGYRIEISQKGNAAAQKSAQNLYAIGRAKFALCAAANALANKDLKQSAAVEKNSAGETQRPPIKGRVSTSESGAQERSLDWLPKVVNWAVRNIPDGKRRLDEAVSFSDEMRKAAEQGLQKTSEQSDEGRKLAERALQEASKLSDKLTPKNPLDFLLLATGPYGVTRNLAAAEAKQLTATALVKAAEEFGETSDGKAFGSFTPKKTSPTWDQPPVGVVPPGFLKSTPRPVYLQDTPNSCLLTCVKMVSETVKRRSLPESFLRQLSRGDANRARTDPTIYDPKVGTFMKSGARLLDQAGVGNTGRLQNQTLNELAAATQNGYPAIVGIGDHVVVVDAVVDGPWGNRYVFVRDPANIAHMDAAPRQQLFPQGISNKIWYSERNFPQSFDAIYTRP